jgi:hypothetical protein
MSTSIPSAGYYIKVKDDARMTVATEVRNSVDYTPLAKTAIISMIFSLKGSEIYTRTQRRISKITI